jgi:hypothetical protein
MLDRLKAAWFASSAMQHACEAYIGSHNDLYKVRLERVLVDHPVLGIGCMVSVADQTHPLLVPIFTQGTKRWFIPVPRA